MVSFGQILLTIFLAILLFGDLPGMIKKVATFIKGTPKVSEKDTKKKKGGLKSYLLNRILKILPFRRTGTRTLSLWFWRPLFYQLNYSPSTSIDSKIRTFI